MTVYLIECEICGEQYTGSKKTKCRSKANNYESTQRKFINKEPVPKQALKQKRFHERYCSDRHNDIEDWVITLIDSADTLKELRKKELYWMYKLKTYSPCGLNERDVIKLKIGCMFSIYNKVTRWSLIMNFFFFCSFIFLLFI